MIGSHGGYSTLASEVSDVLSTAHKNLMDRLIHTPARTHIRIRSPRLAATSAWINVGKGSRQIGSVTLGKGLALRVGYGDSCSDV